MTGSFAAEVMCMMYVAGDVEEPDVRTAEYVETIGVVSTVFPKPFRNNFRLWLKVVKYSEGDFAGYDIINSSLSSRTSVYQDNFA